MSMPSWQPTKSAEEEAAAAAAATAAAAAAGAAAAPATPATPDIERTVFVDSSSVPAAAAAAEPTVAAELVIASGPDSGHSYSLSGPALRIGRAPDNDLILRDPATSGHHARVERRGSQFFIVDLGSTNGTLVNGEVVQERELHNGDSITIGQNAVTFATH